MTRKGAPGMSQGSAKPPAAAKTRTRRFISQFAELELQRQPTGSRGARLGWLLAALVIAAGLALALYDMLSG